MRIEINKRKVDLLKFIKKYPQKNGEKYNWIFFGGTAVELNKLKENNLNTRNHKDIDLSVFNNDFLNKSALFYLDSNYELKIVDSETKLYSMSNTKIELYNNEIPNFEKLEFVDIEFLERKNQKIYFANKEFLLLSYLLLYSKLKEREWESIEDMINTFKFDKQKLKSVATRTKFEEYLTNSFFDSICENNLKKIKREYEKILDIIREDLKIDCIDKYDIIYFLSVKKSKIKNYNSNDINSCLLNYYGKSDIKFDTVAIIKAIKDVLETDKKTKDFLRYLCVLGDIVESKIINSQQRIQIKINIFNNLLSSKILFRYTFSNLKMELNNVS